MVFRKLVGVTPLAYRRRFRKERGVGHMPMLRLSSEVHMLEDVQGQKLWPKRANSVTTGIVGVD
jgi:hypothetical protein